MLPITAEWVDKAEEDFDSALRALRARKKPSYNVASFHAQQCAEKYMKAILVEASIAPPLTHNLAALLGQLIPIDPSWDLHRPDLTTLSAYAVAMRYPGAIADMHTARDAVSVARRAREKARLALGLP